MSRDQFWFFHPFRVRYSEIDGQGVVFNAHYLTYFDTTITEYFRALGYDQFADAKATGFDFHVVKSLIEYKAPVLFDWELDVGARVARIGNSSLTFELAIYLRGARRSAGDRRNRLGLYRPEIASSVADPEIDSGHDRDAGAAIMSFFERLKTAASAEWRAYTEHPFTDAMADGSLPEAAFRHYLVQDYLFLIEFARAYALAIYKSPDLADMRESAAGLSAILDVEMDLHVKLCAGWGLSPDDLEHAPPASEMLAYTRYVLDAGMRGDLLGAQGGAGALRDRLCRDRDAARRAARRARGNQSVQRLDRRICRRAIPGGRGQCARATGRISPIATPRRPARQS